MREGKRVLGLALLAVAWAASPASAAMVDINGSNGWTDGWGDGTPNYATDELSGGASALSGTGVLVYDHVDGDPGRGVDHLFASPLTGTVDISFNLYIPGANEGAFFVAYYGDVGSWGGCYMQSGGCWIEEWSGYGLVTPSLIRNAWQEIKMSLDFTAGTMQYSYNGTPLGSPVAMPDTQIAGFGLPFKESYMGTGFTGPVYFDNFSVVNNGTQIWSENFDSYVPEPATMSLLVLGGLMALRRRRR